MEGTGLLVEEVEEGIISLIQTGEDMGSLIKVAMVRIIIIRTMEIVIQIQIEVEVTGVAEDGEGEEEGGITVEIKGGEEETCFLKTWSFCLT